MKKISLLFYLLILGCWTAQSQQKVFSENLVKQSNFEDYKQYVGGHLTATKDVILYAAEPQTIEVAPFYFKCQQKNKTRTFCFNKLQSHLYRVSVKKIVEIQKTQDKAKIYFQRPVLECKIRDMDFEIIDVIRMDTFRQIVTPFTTKASLAESALLTEIGHLKVSKKQRIKDAEPKIYPCVQIDTPTHPADYPVFVLQDKEQNICYWISPLKASNYRTDELVFKPYLEYLKKKYGQNNYYTKDGTRYLYSDCYVRGREIYLKSKTGNNSSSLIDFVNKRKLQLLLSEQEYNEYIAEQKRQRQLEDEKRRQAALREREEKRQKELAIQRERQELIRQYGSHYANCIEQGKLELGMPKEIVNKVLPISLDSGVFNRYVYTQDGHSYERWTMDSEQFGMLLLKELPEIGAEISQIMLFTEMFGGWDNLVSKAFQDKSVPRTLLFKNGILIEFNN